MLEGQGHELDRITEVVYRILKGKKASPIQLAADYPENEYAQLVSYVNRFVKEYDEFAEFMYSLSRGELDYDPPAGKMRVLQSFKSLQASLRHLTWKTQQIANGDFNQRVDFMGDFSAAFNSMTQQLEQAFTDLKHANADLAEKNQHITASIIYAQRIQQAILPSQELLQRTLGDEHFVVFRPLNIVSGDFYWLARAQDDVLIAAIDCTGHGVPGAFLSMIGHTLLNKIVVEDQVVSPARILEHLHLGIRTALQQETGDTRDGMDVCLCRIHADKQRVTFAGAKRPFYHVSEQQLIETKGDPKSIGGRQKEDRRTFTDQELKVSSGDMLYLCTDGLADQANPDGKKFGSKQFKSLLAEVAPKPTTDQQKQITAQLQDHQLHEPQRDDITVLGVRL